MAPGSKVKTIMPLWMAAGESVFTAYLERYAPFLMRETPQDQHPKCE